MKLTIVVTSLFFLLLFANVVHSFKHDKQSMGRQIIDFNKNWLFEKDDWVGLHNASQPDWDDSKWEKIRLPHSWNMEDTFDDVQGYYRGFGWYRKHFKIADEHRGRKLFIRFGAIYVQAEIWINEKHFGPFPSGYTPITIDITDCINWEGENLIAVRVNNIHNDEIPPGRWRMDYNCYGGIYREVELISVSPVHLGEDDFFVTTPIIEKEYSEIAVQIKVKNCTDKLAETKVVCELFDGANLKAKFEQSMRVPAGLAVLLNNLHAKVNDLKLWSPDDPKLYRLKVTLLQEGEAVDDLVTDIGIRTFGFDAEQGFFLNGKPLQLRGLNRHQCYPGLANAVPPRLQIRDAEILKELGANFVRCSHYPQHPDFLKACDRLGILVYEEVASWQHIGGDVFINTMNRMLEDMIRRDRNHPSIILWGLMNEGRSVKMFEKLQATAHRLDPTRPTCYAENHLKEAVEFGTAFIPDVLGLNYKVQDYDELHSSYPHLRLVNTECSNPDSSIYGDIEKEITGVLKIKNDLDLIESRDYLAGSCIWSMHDYGTEYKPVWPIQKSGVMDVYRRFKEAAYYLQSRWTDEPFVRIAGHWTFTGEEGTVKDVHVWSNCDKVKLFLNNAEVRSDNKHPWRIQYEPGELLAVGHKGKKKVQYSLKTAAEPSKVIIKSLSKEILPDGFDVVPIEAHIVDDNGVTVPINQKLITFDISGPGKLVGIGGANQVGTASGSAMIPVQSTGVKGAIIVTALAEGLTPAKCEIMAN